MNKENMPIDFFAQVKMLSWLQYHERALYFIVSQADLKNNHYRKDIYCLKDGKTVAMTNSHQVQSFSCQKQGLRYLKKGDQPYSTRIETLSYDGKEVKTLLCLPYDIEKVEWLDDEHFFFTALIDLKLERLIQNGMAREAAIQKLKEDHDMCREFVELPFWRNGQGDVSEKRSQLYYYDQGEICCLSDEGANISLLALNSNRRTLYYLEQRIVNGVEENFNRLKSYDLVSGTSQTHDLFDKKVFYDAMTIRDDHTALLTVRLKEKYGENENPQLFLWSLDEKRIQKVYDGDRYNLGNSVGSDVKMGNRRSQPIFLSDGFVLVVTDEDHAPLLKIGYDGSLTMLTCHNEMIQEVIAADEGYYIIAMTDQHLNEIYHLKANGEMIPLTAFHADLEKQYAIVRPQTITYTNENGQMLKGWVMLPPHTSAPYPAILNIHGGPKTVYGPHFFHEMQWLVGQGYAVMMTNPTGSDGLGNAFADIRGRYGTIDYCDLMTFVDQVLATFPNIDANRLGVMGGSYGGFMTNWIIGHTPRFKAAVSQRSIASWAIFENTSDIGTTFGPDQTQADQWHDPQRLWNQSPIQFVPQVKTPTLFLHSDEDTRCWMAEGISMFTALKRFGIDSKLCLFKGENHELSRSGKPQNRIRRLMEIQAWMDHYLK